MALRSMGISCPSIGSVFRPAAAEEPNPSGCPNAPAPAASQRTPSRSRRSLAFLRDRGAASIGALTGWKTNTNSNSNSNNNNNKGGAGNGNNAAQPADQACERPTNSVARLPAPEPSVAAAPRARGGGASGTNVAGSSAQRNGDVSSPPPTPPPATPPPPMSIPATSLGTPQGVAARPQVASHRLAARANQGGLTPPRGPPVRVGPADEEGYHDMVLPCGLYQDEVIDIMYRDLSPEDFEALSKLDERIPKRNTARWNIVDRLPRVPAGECAVTECGVCLAELEPSVVVAKLPCRHAFHPNCISRWLTQCKNTCPLCQAPIQQQQLQQQPQQPQQQPQPQLPRGGASASQAPIQQQQPQQQQQQPRGGMNAMQASNQQRGAMLQQASRGAGSAQHASIHQGGHPRGASGPGMAAMTRSV